MLKEAIISKLYGLVEKLGAVEKERESWKEFLITVAEAYGKEDFKDKLGKSIRSILDLVGVERLLWGVKFLSSEIDRFPIIDVYDSLIEILSKMEREKDSKIRELSGVLAELSTPIVHLWKGVLLVPLIGTLDSQRAQNLVERLLNKIAESRTEVVIIDVTGVPMIDTLVGGFLIEMFMAVKLLGSDVVLCGIKPEIAHTLVKLNIDFNMVVVKRDLESALQYAIRKMSKDKKQTEEAKVEFSLEQEAKREK